MCLVLFLVFLAVPFDFIEGAVFPDNVTSSFRVSAEQPCIYLASPANDTIHQSGTFIDLVVNDTIRISQALYNWDGATNTTLSYPYTEILPKGDGQHVLHVFAENIGGYWTYRKYVFTTDDTSPTMFLEHPPTIPLNYNITDVNGLSQVVYNWDGSANTSISSPYKVPLPKLTSGHHILYIYACDTADNWAMKTFHMGVDTTMTSSDVPGFSFALFTLVLLLSAVYVFSAPHKHNRD